MAPRTSPGVRPDDTMAEAGRKILRFHFDRMLDHEPGTRLGEDPEELHDMRVATRRSRAAWRVFGTAFEARTTRRHRRRLRRVGTLLGRVRDLDVLLEATDAYQSGLGEEQRPGLEPLLSAWRTDRDEARGSMIRGLDAPWYRAWVAAYGEFTGTEGAAAAAVLPNEPHLVREAFPALLWAAYGHVRAFEPAVAAADLATLHALRIAAKRMRYTLEFGREVLAPEAATLVARVVELQDHLGLLNDAWVGSRLAAAFLSGHRDALSAEQVIAVERYIETRDGELTGLRRTVGGPWRAVAGLAFRRGLGRVAASL